jgi:Mrp family chromosome partitioning ATPase
MSTNQAFIKAYRQDAAQTAPARPTSIDAPRPSAAVPAISVEYVSVAAGSIAAMADARIPTAAQQPPATGQIRLPAKSESRNDAIHWPACDAPFGRIEQSAASGKRPLSTLIGQRAAVMQRTETVPSSPSSAAFHPATTLASFSWPAVCRTLCQQHGAEFDRVADLLIRQADEARTLIGVIGMFPRLGSTTTLLCLAARVAARGRKAIVVEGNFLTPRLAGWLDAEPTAWWQDVLERHVPVTDAVIRAADEKLDLLPLSTGTSDPLRLAGGLQASATAWALRNAYDLVLVDLGAFFDPESQPIALELVRNMRIDAALAVAGPDGADPRDLATIAEYLGRSGCQLLGTVENRVAQPPTAGSAPPHKVI